MQRCPRCSRHVLEEDSQCPFCAARFEVVTGATPVAAALAGLWLFACGGDPGGETTAATTGGSMVASTGMDSMSSGMTTPTTGTTGMAEATSAGASTSTGGETSSTSSSSSSGPDSSTSTSSAETTTTAESSSSASTSGSTSTDESSGSSSAGESSGGDDGCPIRNEEPCGGVCKNTQYDPEHCGGCFMPCDDWQGCAGGDCYNITPYGGPVPEPLWV